MTAPAALKSVRSALELLRPREGHVTLAIDELKAAAAELEAQAEGWEAVRMMLDAEPHVCTCDHSDTDPELAGCSEGMGSRCRFEKALRTMAGFDG